MLTMGGEGLIAFEELPDARQVGEEYRSRVRGQHVPALSGYPVDPLGCGDALLAAATLTMCCGGSVLAAAMIGSLSAAVQAQRLGNVAVTAGDLRAALVRVMSAKLAVGAGGAGGFGGTGGLEGLLRGEASAAAPVEQVSTTGLVGRGAGA